MDKKTMLKLIDDRSRGERCRVLFDLLMDAVGANFEMKQHEVFECIKKAVEAEQEAIKTLMQMSGVSPEVPEQGSDDMPETITMKEAHREFAEGMRSSAGSSPAEE